MPRYIDADEMIKNLTGMKKMYDAIDLDGMIKGIGDNVLDIVPQNDGIVPIVLCKDCKHHFPPPHKDGEWAKCKRSLLHTKMDDFCSYGERNDT